MAVSSRPAWATQRDRGHTEGPGLQKPKTNRADYELGDGGMAALPEALCSVPAPTLRLKAG